MQGILPVVGLLAVVVRILVMEIEHAGVAEVLQIRADLVVAGVEVVAVLIGGVERIVAHRVEDTRHRRELLVRVVDVGGALGRHRGSVEHLLQRPHQRIGEHQADHHDRVHADDDEDAAQHRAEDLPIGLLHLVIEIERLFYHTDEREGKDERDADRRHAEIDGADDAVPEEYVDEILVFPIVGCRCDAGEDIEQILHPADRPAKHDLQIIEYRIDDIIQYVVDTLLDLFADIKHLSSHLQSLLGYIHIDEHTCERGERDQREHQPL